MAIEGMYCFNNPWYLALLQNIVRNEMHALDNNEEMIKFFHETLMMWELQEAKNSPLVQCMEECCDILQYKTKDRDKSMSRNFKGKRVHYIPSLVISFNKGDGEEKSKKMAFMTKVYQVLVMLGLFGHAEILEKQRNPIILWNHWEWEFDWGVGHLIFEQLRNGWRK